MLAGTWSNRNSYSMLLGVQNGLTTVGGDLVVYYKVNIFLIYDLAVILLGVSPKLNTSNYTETYT